MTVVIIVTVVTVGTVTPVVSSGESHATSPHTKNHATKIFINHELPTYVTTYVTVVTVVTVVTILTVVTVVTVVSSERITQLLQKKRHNLSIF